MAICYTALQPLAATHRLGGRRDAFRSRADAMENTFWVRRTITVFFTIGAALFAVSLLKGRGTEAALIFAASWSAVSTAIFITTRVVRSRRGEHCELCQDTPQSMLLPRGAV